MRVRFTLSDGRDLSTGSRLRYACFRLTVNGGIATMHSNSAEEAVKHARYSWHQYGFKNVVIDTVSAELIATFPAMNAQGEPIEIKEHTID
jgi:hypothetical protein